MSQIYPDILLTETKETAEFAISEIPEEVPEIPEDEAPSSPVNWLFVAVTAVLCMMVVAVTSSLKKKRV